MENAGAVKEIEQRVHSLSGILASPVREDDHVEKARRIELQRFVLIIYVYQQAHALPENSRGFSQSLNLYPTKMLFLDFCATPIMQKL